MRGCRETRARERFLRRALELREWFKREERGLRERAAIDELAARADEIRG